MKRKLFLLACLIASLILASCNLPGQNNTGGPNAWIDAPLTGSTVLVNSKVLVVSHSSDSSGITNVELSVNDSVLNTDAVPESGQTYILMKQKWTPTQTGTYQVRVRAQASGGQWSDYAIVTIDVLSGPLSATPITDTPTLVQATATVLTSTPSMTPPPLRPSLTLTVNAFCRRGPDVSFPDITAIPQGGTVDIVGVSQDGFWYFVYWKQFDARCWVAANTGQASGNIQGVPVMVSPPTETPVPTSRRP